jgi:hypothetical protein
MALKSVKQLIENKGYFIEQKDRAIFETGDLRSFFGFSENDAIEFIVYDDTNNQLPQGNGEMVRYIPLSTENINDYFLVPDGTVFQKYNLPKEYFIDAERLLREAGYNSGVYKTQITLINKRVGSEKELDKLWISEISPSRTEIRLFPLRKNQPPELIKNLEERFGIFVENKKFREDYIYQAFQYIEKINPSLISSFLKTKYGNEFFDVLVNEYKIQSFDVFVTDIHKRFIEASIYEFTNRISNINDVNYGKPKKTKPPVTITEAKIKSSIEGILVSLFDKYLASPDIVTKSSFDNKVEQSVDPISEIIQSKTSDIEIPSGDVKVTKKIGIVTKPIEKDSSIKLKELIKKQLPIIGDQPPPIIKTPIDELPIFDLPPLREEIVVKEEPVVIKTNPIGGISFGGGGGGNRGRVVVNDRNNLGIDLGGFFENLDNVRNENFE